MPADGTLLPFRSGGFSSPFWELLLMNSTWRVGVVIAEDDPNVCYLVSSSRRPRQGNGTTSQLLLPANSARSHWWHLGKSLHATQLHPGQRTVMIDFHRRSYCAWVIERATVNDYETWLNRWFFGNR
jgi:hypothetical protein